MRATFLLEMMNRYDMITKFQNLTGMKVNLVIVKPDGIIWVPYSGPTLAESTSSKEEKEVSWLT